jgi:outer membrane protein OmpA-like peptidoglycan-associated protein
VKQHLLEKGAREGQLVIKGYGEVLPLQPNTSDANRAINRRVEFKILKAG